MFGFKRKIRQVTRTMDDWGNYRTPTTPMAHPITPSAQDMVDIGLLALDLLAQNDLDVQFATRLRTKDIIDDLHVLFNELPEPYQQVGVLHAITRIRTQFPIN